MAECVKVIVRCRPMNTREKDLKCNNVVVMDSKRGQCSIQNPSDSKVPPKTFTFDGAYFIDSTTEQIYSDIAYPLVEGVTEGYNGTIFAYGQTGCGKSFSMQGVTDPPKQRGIIPRAFAHIFETTGLKEGTKYLIHASYLEIYNEEIRDLLGKDPKAKLDLKEHPEKGVYVSGLSMHPVHNVNECEHVMNKGWHNRSTGATLMNADSSRSHSIFTISMEMATTDEEGEDHIRAGKLNLVDLAGSERQGKTGATGDRLKEATKINLSLSALGNVISALVDGKSKHIPYRDSKLTRLLQDSLGGNTKTMMVACLSPADNNYDETLSTLRYANRAKNIKNKPKINEDPKDALLRQYQEEIEKLKAMLAGQMAADAGMPVASAPVKSAQHVERESSLLSEDDIREKLEEEKDKIRMEYEDKMSQMQMAFEEEKHNKVKLQQDMDILRDFYDEKMRTVDGRLADLPTTAQVLGEDEIISEKGGAGGDGIKKKKELTATVVPTPDSTSSDDNAIVGPDISDIGKPMVLGPDGLPHIERKEEEDEDEDDDSTTEMTFYGLERVEKTDSEQKSQQSPEREQQVGEDAGGEDVQQANLPPEQDSEIEAKQKEAMARLMALQQQMVGGENVHDEKAKVEHEQKLHHADKVRVKLNEANSNLEDDGIMLTIFDNVQDELKAKNDILENKKQQISSLESEILDLQSEFEFDRVDYLDTIRKQEKQIAYFEALIDRIHPCLRRDCNYFNLDKVKQESRYNEEDEKWILPKMSIDRTALPVTGTVLPNTNSQRRSFVQHYEQDEDVDDERLREKLRRSEDRSHILQPKRAAQLLNSSDPVMNKLNMQEVRESIRPNKPLTGSVNGFHLESEPMSKDLRAAQVHGQIYNDEVMRKPTRLDALPAVNTKKSRKKRNNLDAL